MAPQRVTLRVPIHEHWDARDRLQVYSDFGDGSIDTSKPLLARPLEVLPGEVVSTGFGVGSFGRARFGDNKPSRPRTGVFGREVFGVTPFCNSTPFIELAVDVPAAFGTWKFAVQAVDRLGKVQSGALLEIEAVVSGTEPAPLSTFAFNSYDSETDRVTFDFTKSTE